MLVNFDALNAEFVIDDPGSRIGKVPVCFLHLHEHLLAGPSLHLVGVRVQRQSAEFALNLLRRRILIDVQQPIVIHFFLEVRRVLKVFLHYYDCKLIL